MARIRVVMAKPGLDSHYRGAMVVSRYLVNQGMEVVYVGNQSAEQIVQTVVQEDADVLGLSSLSGNHQVMVPPILAGLRAQVMGHVVVLLGGIVPAAHIPRLQEAGVDAVFGPGTDLKVIAEFVTLRVAEARAPTR
jgi:methylmalonyl-CoA mutase, C-terminal domain